MKEDDDDYSSIDEGAQSKKGQNSGDGAAALAAAANGNPLDDKSSVKPNIVSQAAKVERKRLSSQERVAVKSRNVTNESSIERQSMSNVKTKTSTIETMKGQPTTTSIDDFEIIDKIGESSTIELLRTLHL